MSLQEKGRVLRLAVSLLGKAAGRESILPASFTNRCRSLVPLGAGTTAGVKAGLYSHAQRRSGTTCAVCSSTAPRDGPNSSRKGWEDSRASADEHRA